MTDWKITITDNSGTSYTPHIYAPPGEVYPKEIPAANGVPTLQVGVQPLSGSDSWFDAKFENADVTVKADYNEDGTFVTQPYTSLTANESESTEQIVVLEAEGGDELEKSVDTGFDVIETHTAASNVVTNNTSYNTDIPTPSTTTSTDELVRDRSSGVNSDDIKPQPDTSPAHVDGNNDLTLYQTLFFNAPSTTLSAVGDSFSFTFTTDYAIPADDVGVGFLSDTQNDIVGVECAVDGTVVLDIPPGTDYSKAPVWDQDVGADARLTPGSHDLTVEVTETEDSGGNSLSSVSPNGVCVYDDRFNYTFDPGLSNGPELYPTTQENTYVEFEPAITTRAVTGINFDGTYQDGEEALVTVSTGGQTATNLSGDIDNDFSDRGAAVRAKIGFNAYGFDTSKTPSSGFKVTTLQSYTLKADLETMPMVVDEEFQGTVADVLTELADTLRGDFIWTFDTDSNGNKTVRFVRSGARSTTDNDIERFSLTKTSGNNLQEVTVRGGRVTVDSEGVRAQHGTAVPLNRDNIVTDSETVERDGVVYERGVHYSIDYANGTITVDGNPARAQPIPDGSLIRVSYQFQPEATVSNVSSPTRTETIDLLPLRSDAACSLAAEQILTAASAPSYNAQARLRSTQPFSVVEELVAGRLPVSNLEPTSITATPSGSVVNLEARQRIGEVVSDVRNRIQAVARNVRG